MLAVDQSTPAVPTISYNISDIKQFCKIHTIFIINKTADLLVFVTNKWNTSLEFHSESQVIAFDILTVFDRVWQKNLLHKFLCYSITPKLYTHISRYLSDRQISVMVNEHSSFYPINAGDPKKSVVVFNLFFLNISDQVSTTSNFIHTYSPWFVFPLAKTSSHLHSDSDLWTICKTQLVEQNISKWITLS